MCVDRTTARGLVMMAMKLQRESSSRSLRWQQPARRQRRPTASERASARCSKKNPSRIHPSRLWQQACSAQCVAPISSQLPSTVGRSILRFSARLTAHSGRRICNGQKFHSLPGSVRVESLRTRGSNHSGSRAIRSRSHRQLSHTAFPIAFSFDPSTNWHPPCAWTGQGSSARG